MDSNGYNASLLDTHEGTCYLTHRQGETVRHEIFFGVGNRKLSKEYGCWCYLHPETHADLHAGKGDYDDYLKHLCYRKFCEKYGRQYFYELFRRYYDDQD